MSTQGHSFGFWLRYQPSFARSHTTQSPWSYSTPVLTEQTTCTELDGCRLMERLTVTSCYQQLQVGSHYHSLVISETRLAAKLWCNELNYCVLLFNTVSTVYRHLSLDSTRQLLYYTDSYLGIVGEIAYNGYQNRMIINDIRFTPTAIAVDTVNRYKRGTCICFLYSFLILSVCLSPALS